MAEQESMEFDVVVVGAGPAGLSAACRIKQLAKKNNLSLSVCILEKGAEVGAHILSGAIFEPSILYDLFPNWKEEGAPLDTPVTTEKTYILHSGKSSLHIPNFFVPLTMHNAGNYVISLGSLCRWLAKQAEALGVEIFPGFAAQSINYDNNGVVKGVITGDMGVTAAGGHKTEYMPGICLNGKYTVFAEGARGHLGQELIKGFKLDKSCIEQHYSLGIKELWEASPEWHNPGEIIHLAGWPLRESSTQGGGFIYHLKDQQLAVGLIIDLGYRNPYLDPYEEFQRFKQHPFVKKYLIEGRRLSYGARAIAKGGLAALPKMTFPGGMLIGCDAGTLNYGKIKGSHTAMQSGYLAGEAIVHGFKEGFDFSNTLESYDDLFKASSTYKELYKQRNFGPFLHRFGPIVGGGLSWLDLNLFRGKLPFTLNYSQVPSKSLHYAKDCKKIYYPPYDNVVSFDRMSSVFLSNTNHTENQPCHLVLHNPDIPINENLPNYEEPAVRYCPAGVYEIITEIKTEKKIFQINSQNCIHCKTCDIKDPAQNIQWIPPEGGGGPNYPNM